jgi:hypothetical protein
MLWYSIECPQEKQKAASTSSAELNIHHAILGGQFLMYKCLATWYLRYEKRLSICKNKISWITMKTVLGTLWVIMHRIKYSLETPRLKLINIYYWKSCRRLSRWNFILFSRSSLCWSKMCFSAQELCMIPISQNSQEVTNSKSRNTSLHRLHRSPPTSRSDNGFNHPSRHRIIISMSNHVRRLLQHDDGDYI